MTSDASKSPEQVAEMPVAAGAAPPPDDHVAEALRGFGPLGIFAILVILAGTFLAPLSAFLVLLWAWRSRTPWRDIGYIRPKSWIGSLIVGIVFGTAFKLLMKTIVMPLLGAPEINSAYHYLAGNQAALLGAVYTMIVVGGFGEETVFRGFLFERLGKLLGHGAWVKAFTVLVTSALFGLGHYTQQGLAGMEQAMMTGFVFGTIFAVTGRIFLPMCIHAAYDLTALAIIYLDIESEVAHLVFK